MTTAFHLLEGKSTKGNDALTLTQLPFPCLLTSAHALAGCIGSILSMQFGVFTPRELTFKEAIMVFTFSLLYTSNIASSNCSL